MLREDQKLLAKKSNSNILYATTIYFADFDKSLT
jgi:hypothetical protein